MQLFQEQPGWELFFFFFFFRGESAYFAHSSSALKSEQSSSVTLDGFCAVNECEEGPEPQ